MRIGLDIDDTLLNTHKVLVKFICKYYKLDYNKYKYKKYDYFKKNCDNFFEVAMENYGSLIQTVSPKFGLRRYLNKLKKEGHEIYLISCRDCKEFEDPYKTTIEYLEYYKIPYDKIILNVSDKVEACINNKIDIFVDDNEEHCNRVLETGIDVYLMNHYTNYENKNIKRLYSIKDIYDAVKKKGV